MRLLLRLPRENDRAMVQQPLIQDLGCIRRHMRAFVTF